MYAGCNRFNDTQLGVGVGLLWHQGVWNSPRLDCRHHRLTHSLSEWQPIHMLSIFLHSVIHCFFCSFLRLVTQFFTCQQLCLAMQWPINCACHDQVLQPMRRHMLDNLRGNMRLRNSYLCANHIKCACQPSLTIECILYTVCSTCVCSASDTMY